MREALEYLRSVIPSTPIKRKTEVVAPVRPEGWKPRGPQIKTTLSHKTLCNLYEYGVCHICGGVDKDRNLAIDHCHQTGKMRGLLCMGCNTALGRFKDNPDLLRKAAEYIEKHRG